MKRTKIPTLVTTSKYKEGFMDNLDIRVTKLEEGMGLMQISTASSNSLITQLKETLKDLGDAFKEFSVTNVKTQSSLESLQKEIERGSKSQELLGRKIDSLAKFSADIESIKGSHQLLEVKQRNDYDKLENKISINEKKIDTLASDFKTHCIEFEDHQDESKLDIIKSLKDGSGWLLSVILGLALIWSLFGQIPLRLP